MPSRYNGRKKFRNNDPLYDNIFEERDVTAVVQYTTPKFHGAGISQFNRLSIAQELWTTGDRLYKLAAKHYGSGRYWGGIARFNKTPTDAHFQIGDTVYIPLPREVIFEIYNV